MNAFIREALLMAVIQGLLAFVRWLVAVIERKLSERKEAAPPGSL